jgi:hypothetical protein
MRIAFGESEVEIRADDTLLLGSLAESYRHMKGTGRGPASAVAEIRRSDTGYRVTSATGVSARREKLGMAIRWARQQVTEGFIRARGDLLWMHGAAVGRGSGALLLPGRRGQGKSTLATALCARGWSFLTDDLVPLDPASLRIIPFPRVPEVREDPGEDHPVEWLNRAPKRTFDIRKHISPEALTVAAIVFPRARRGGAVGALDACTSAEAVLAIAEGCWNFSELGTLAPATLSRLVAGVPSRTMSFSDADAAAETLTAWYDGGGRTLR